MAVVYIQFLICLFIVHEEFFEGPILFLSAIKGSTYRKHARNIPFAGIHKLQIFH